MTMDFTRPVGKASGIPWAGIENTPPEVQNLSKPEMAFLKLPFDPLEYIEHLDQLPFDPESGPALGNSAAPPESHSPEKREGATLLGHQQPVRMRVAWVRGKGFCSAAALLIIPLIVIKRPCSLKKTGHTPAAVERLVPLTVPA